MSVHEIIRSLVTKRPCGLLTDIDGTISPIAATPEEARVLPDAQLQLQELVRYLAVVGAISGRAASDAAAMIGIPDMIYVGNHGMEVWQQGTAKPVPEAQAFVEAIGSVIHDAQQRILLPGVLFENKGVTASIHYRLTPEPHVARRVIQTTLQPLAAQHGLRMTEGRLVWELRPPIEINKGTAIQRVVEQHGLKSVMFLGDDRTDADAFKVLRELRAKGVCTTLNVGILAAETPAVVRELADVMVDGVAGAAQFLADVLALVANEQGRSA